MRPMRILIVVLVFLPVSLFLASLLTSTSWWRNTQENHAEANSFQVLLAAKKPEGLEDAVTDLGVVLRMQDKSWIAIRYCDHHGGGIWSSAVAVDSDDRWYTSRQHFCGKSHGYDLDRNKDKELLELRGEFFQDLRSIENCPDLDGAKPKFLKLGFTEVIKPTLQENH